MKKTRIISGLLAMIICASAMTVATTPVAAAGRELQQVFPGASIPQLKNYTWYALDGVESVEKQSKYFVINTSVNGGASKEKLFISLPEEGGFRVQTLHQSQINAGKTEPEVACAGLFEPKSIKKIKYKTEGAATVFTGTDGTTVKYTGDGNGFTIQIYSKEDEKIVSLTNKQISYAYNKNGEVIRSMVEMPLANKEAIYGGGERFNSANQVGKKINLSNVDCWGAADNSYQNVAIFHSNRGYSMWYNMTYSGEADIGEYDPSKYSVMFDGSKLEFTVWQGMPIENVQKFTSLTGTSGVSEEWVYGFWTGAQNEAFNRGAGAYANVTDLLDNYIKRYNFYPEAFFAEGAVARNSMCYNAIASKGIKVLGWYSSDIYKDIGSGFEAVLPGVSQLPRFNNKGVMIDTGWPLTFNSSYLKYYNIFKHTEHQYLDYTNPNAGAVVDDVWAKYWDWGISGTMLDFGEWTTYTDTYFNGLKGDEMHNLFSYYYGKVLSEQWQKAKGNNDYVLFSRSGSVGHQYWASEFLGDINSTYAGLKSVVSASISMGSSGFNNYGSDLGGHWTSGVADDLWNRWVTFSLFSPYMRQHGTQIHKPWEHGIAATKNFGYNYYFRKNIVPTVLSAAIQAEKTANPIVQGMMVAYPYQLSLIDYDSQYLFCDNLLVCPVLEENVVKVKVSLPKGSTWYDLATYKAYDGGTVMNAEAPSTGFPVYIKGGTAMAIQLPDSYEFADEIHDDSGDEYEAHDALLITPPDNDRTNVIWNKDGISKSFHDYKATSETYTLSRSGDATFTVTNKDRTGRGNVVLVGAKAASVKVDGKELKRLDHKPDYYSKEYGYYIDLKGKTIINTESGWKKLEITKGNIEYKSLHMTAVGDDATLNNILDDSFETTYELAADDKPVVKLDSVTEISKILVKWDRGFADSYDIEYSTDGIDWYIIEQEDGDRGSQTVTNGAGAYDYISFAPVKAQYLRVVVNAIGDTGVPAIQSFEVYEPDSKYLPAVITPVTDDDNKWDGFDDKKYDEDVDWKDDQNNGDQDGDNSNGNNGSGPIKKPTKKTITLTEWNTTAIIILVCSIAAGVLLVAGLIVFFILKRKKKKEQEAGTTQE